MTYKVGDILIANKDKIWAFNDRKTNINTGFFLVSTGTIAIVTKIVPSSDKIWLKIEGLPIEGWWIGNLEYFDRLPDRLTDLERIIYNCEGL